MCSIILKVKKIWVHYMCHHNPLLIINCSPIYKDRIFWKKILENKEMVFKHGVINTQAQVIMPHAWYVDLWAKIFLIWYLLLGNTKTHIAMLCTLLRVASSIVHKKEEVQRKWQWLPLALHWVMTTIYVRQQERIDIQRTTGKYYQIMYTIGNYDSNLPFGLK